MSLLHNNINITQKILEWIKNELDETKKNATGIRFTFQKIIKIPKEFEIVPKVHIQTDKEKLKNMFYEITKYRRLEIYVDAISIDYVEKRLYDDEKQSHYLSYSTPHIISFLSYPNFSLKTLCFSTFWNICCVINNSLMYPYSWVRNTICGVINGLVVYPFVQIYYIYNPVYYFFAIDMRLRKSICKD